MHDIAGVSITVATILAATFFSNQFINSLRSEMMGKLRAIRNDTREVYAEQECPDVRITNREQQQKR